MLKSHFGSFGGRWSLLALAAGALNLFVNTRRAGLGVRGGEWQHSPEECWKAPKESSRPVWVAEEGTGGQHCVGEHPCGALTFSIR